MEKFLSVPTLLGAAIAIGLFLTFLIQNHVRQHRLLSRAGLSAPSRGASFNADKSRKLITFLMLLMSVILAALGACIVITQPGAASFVGAALFVFGLNLFKVCSETKRPASVQGSFDFFRKEDRLADTKDF